MCRSIGGKTMKGRILDIRYNVVGIVPAVPFVNERRKRQYTKFIFT